MPYNYKQICLDLVKDLSPRTRDIVSRRFGLKKENLETLQTIGNSYNITRERVRQIESDGFRKIKPILANYENALNHFQNHIKDWGGVKKEDRLLSDLGGEKLKNQVFFLLSASDMFERCLECNDYHTLWSIEESSLASAEKIINSLLDKLKKIKSPLSKQELFDILQKEGAVSETNNFTIKALSSFLDVSKNIWQSPNGFWGLPDWPEINPRGIRDKAYIVFKDQKKPLHFRDVADFITELKQNNNKALPQTVHNELIRDTRFILVGRGIYALKEWGYEPGVVKDIVSKVLKQSKKPLTRKEIVNQVLIQRLVRPSTVLANLQDRDLFIRDLDGRYKIKTKNKI